MQPNNGLERTADRTLAHSRLGSRKFDYMVPSGTDVLVSENLTVSILSECWSPILGECWGSKLVSAKRPVLTRVLMLHCDRQKIGQGLAQMSCERLSGTLEHCTSIVRFAQLSASL